MNILVHQMTPYSDSSECPAKKQLDIVDMGSLKGKAGNIHRKWPIVITNIISYHKKYKSRDLLSEWCMQYFAMYENVCHSCMRMSFFIMSDILRQLHIL